VQWAALTFRTWRRRLRTAQAAEAAAGDDEAPLRAELFSADQMAQHGVALARAHVIGHDPRRDLLPDPLLVRLSRNQQVLGDSRGLLTRAVKNRQRIAPAGEWLLDNFYLIDEQIRTAREHLPRHYSQELPRLAGGPSDGTPRIYDLALSAIAHGDGRIDAEVLLRFVAAYQTVTPLLLGELWAVPIMLRLALIENLRRVAARITAARLHLDKAEIWADRMLAMAERDPKNLILVVADMARSAPPMASAFVAELSRRLQGHGTALALPLNWIEQRLAEDSQTIEQLVMAENQQQAADQVSIGNSIGSLRFLIAMDWRVFVETMSAVEQLLRQDPLAVYADMDFASRDACRQVVDQLAKRSPRSEPEIAATALAMAADVGDDLRHQRHVGYWLMAEGRLELERRIAYQPSLRERLGRRLLRRPLLLHLTAIAGITVAVTAALLASAGWQRIGWPLLLPLTLLLLIIASQFASMLANGLATRVMRSTRLPRLDFSAGLPAEQRTVVAVPCLLTDSSEVERLLEALELHAIGNDDPQLHFALLSDFRDAASETLADDDTLLAQAQAGIERLNRRDGLHGSAGRFHLLHRSRSWNAAEGCWMGHERKRGKLSDLNALLRGRQPSRLVLTLGDTAALIGIRYVITLDCDTRMPRDAARQMIGTMAHPLNRPRLDVRRQCIGGGHGILQPRMATSLDGGDRSRYARLCGSEPGIDPYTRIVSDVYQDAFGEGSFIGKGIYDVDAFETVLRGRLPENRILSHDLLEGCYLRCGLLADVHLFEAYPSRYSSDVLRHWRWIRGDWQIAGWLRARVPGADGHPEASPLSRLSRWKLFDNLRRSLVSPALLLLLIGGWLWLPMPLLWTLAAIAVPVLPALLFALADALVKPEQARWQAHWRGLADDLGSGLALSAFRLVCLPHDALMHVDALARTLWRTRISHRHLLEWRASATLPNATDEVPAPCRAGIERMLPMTPLLAIGVGVALLLLRPAVLPGAAPLLVGWLLAPWLAIRMSRPPADREPPLSADQVLFLRRIARRTWAFFEDRVGAADHWLPPDNHQEHPGPITAHRTSPTNIGLALLANLAAEDFGYLSTAGLLLRTRRSFDSMAKLGRHRGHFFNWHDTLNLQPLLPRYISTVDSGNLSGHLLTLRAALLALPQQRIVDAGLFAGLNDTAALIEEAVIGQDPTPILRLRALLNNAIGLVPNSLSAMQHSLVPVCASARRLSTDLVVIADSELAYWIAALERQCRDIERNLIGLAPWLDMPTAGRDYEVVAELDEIPSLQVLAEQQARLGPVIAALRAAQDDPAEQAVLAELAQHLALGSARAAERIAECRALADEAAGYAAVEYEFLYDRSRHLLAIGYNVDEFRRDLSHYDLLASEARLASFIAIAQGQLPQESWFALGRLRTASSGAPILVSWSGSMFEYLMPLLVMPNYAGTLLDQTCRAAVARQIEHGEQAGLPWGVSESGYNTVDAGLNYQYHAFGVPGLGLKRGLGEDRVIAPYASALALLVMPDAACRNLQRLAAEGTVGRHGFYEAIDHTPSRLPRGESQVLVRSFMAHHQGMSLLAIGSALLGQRMQRRFASDLQMQATLLLLQERIPRHALIRIPQVDFGERSPLGDLSGTQAQPPLGADTPAPEVQLLSNGRYHVMISNAGGSYSLWKDLAVTRWREDATCDSWGSFLYLRDVDSGDVWSAAHQPTGVRASRYEALFGDGRAEFRRLDQDIETWSETVVSPEDDIELRRVRITNRSRVTRTLELTSYAEVVLAAVAADATQPSFGNLFVQTELLPARRAILCTRRPRSPGDATPWMFHLVAVNGSRIEEPSYETDRLRFIGRGRGGASPQAIVDGGPLSGSAGSVLDPCVAIRCRVTLDAGQAVTLDWITGCAAGRDDCLALVGRYQDRHLADRVLDLAWTHNSVTLSQINATEADARLYRRLAGAVVYASAGLRAAAAVLVQNRRNQSGLWGYAISGDLPIVLLKIADSRHIELARQMIQCHAWWRLKGLVVDLVIWNEDHVGYRQQLQDQIVGLIATGHQALDRPGGIFVRSAEQISQEDRVLLQSVARLVIVDSSGTLAEQVNRRTVGDKRMARLLPTRSPRAELDMALPPMPLRMANGLGGYRDDGREYCITSSAGQRTPLPWVNVLANAGFGTVVSESGLAYTWSENAHEFRLTPWHDDPVGGHSGEAIYLRDEDSGEVWSPTAWPVGDAGAVHRCRHGFGYSVFEHHSHGIHSELWVYVDLDEAVKFSVLKVRNASGRSRRLSATGYVEWVLGELRPRTAMHVITEIDASSGALFARNAYSTEFGERVAFFDVDDASRTLTADRGEFIGRNGRLSAPAALGRVRLSGRVGAGLDPCGAIQVPFELAHGATREIIFRLGAGRDLEQARHLARRFRRTGSARNALDRVRDYWQRTLGTVRIDTPDEALNLLANGWLVYQTLACRLWARSGWFQSGGAYGFRDQLQDSMALVHAEPGLLREHLLRAASRQFPAGDVQHWWHPPVGRGVRTRCSDDYLWLPLALCRYVEATADTGVLDEPVPWLDGRALADGEESYYDLPGRSHDTATLYRHAVQAIEHGLRFGERGLPLIGSGDWNDGMNRVGLEGRGESVWLGFFLCRVLDDFARLADRHGDPLFAARCLAEALRLGVQLEEQGWDGDWYRRAWFDDGRALGTAGNDECRIDSIAQSWSVLSGAGEPTHARQAMAALDRELVDRERGLVRLLTPPFDRSGLEPGYIKGYVPGVRENGGQYTHAAIWAAMAFAELGDHARAWELTTMINPVNHGRSATEVALYKAEPYVVAADVYAVPPHTGRAGWSWYTGSAGWFYRLIVESLLGVTRAGSRLQFRPCLPEGWPRCALDYRYRDSVYRIEMVQVTGDTDAPSDTVAVRLDGALQQGLGVPLSDDRQPHRIDILIRRAASKPQLPPPAGASAPTLPAPPLKVSLPSMEQS